MHHALDMHAAKRYLIVPTHALTEFHNLCLAKNEVLGQVGNACSNANLYACIRSCVLSGIIYTNTQLLRRNKYAFVLIMDS